MRIIPVVLFALWLALPSVAAHSAPTEEVLPTLPLRLPTGQSLLLELAATPVQRSLGLMFRAELDDEHGMLFIFPSQDYHAIWMKNMLITLDILWLDDQKRIVHIETNVPPCQRPPCAIYRPASPAQYVIELAAGSVARHQLSAGGRLSFQLDDTPPLPLPIP